MKTDNIDLKIKNFSETVSHKIYGDNDYELQFYMTERCNLRCPGCYKNAGPHRCKTMLPSADIREYIGQFKALPNFSGGVCFSGGEVFEIPLDKLESDIRYVLDSGCRLQLKTNGAWVENPDTADKIFNMLRGLRVKHDISGTAEEFDRVFGGDLTDKVQGMSRIRRAVELSRILYRAKKNNMFIPRLSMSVSVDNLIHPSASARWYLDIARRIGGDNNLRRNVIMMFFCFYESSDFVIEKILDNPSLDKKILSMQGGWIDFMLFGARHAGALGGFKDMKHRAKPNELARIDVPCNNGGANRTVWFFNPDRTVCFEADMIPVGRVSYIDECGKYKSFDRLRDEMAAKLVVDYRRALTR